MNYSRFYAAFNKLPYDGDREDLRHSIIMEYTDHRTDSLRMLSEREYNNLCESIERKVRELNVRQPKREYLKKKRRTVLVLLSSYGIDTTSWEEVNRFCQQKQIAGKLFSKLTAEELDNLSRKMRSILGKLTQ
jgi:hypothetical protein